MNGPRLFFGEAGGGRLLLFDEGHTDAGEAIDFRAESVPVAPAGTGGATEFSRLFLTFVHSMGVRLYVLPILDGVELLDELVLVELPARAQRLPTVVEIELSRASRRADGTVFGRRALLGTWLAVRIYSAAGIAAGDLLVEGVALETEALEDGRTHAEPMQ